MSEPSTAPGSAATVHPEPIVNRLSVQVATVNGSGSQTANSTLLRAIFQMGIPVSGKNLFPSNIAGLPTWFTIRANSEGYIARRKEIDVLVCMNAQTAREDVAGVPPGATVIFEESLNLAGLRDDVDFHGVPFAKIVRDVCPVVGLRRLVVNMIYVGVVAELIGIELQEIESALKKAFATKPKALDLNVDAVKAGLAWAQENITAKPRFQVRRMNKTAGKVLVDGNYAAAVGALFAGVTVAAWYPITPSSSLTESLIELAGKYRVDEKTGKNTIAIIQAEDELAAIGNVIGAAWAGARAMTSTSGPGISLMSEFIGLAYYAEVPAVIVNVQRTGPSTGLPTRTMQGDVMFCAYNSHGDTRHPCLYPANIEEAYTFTMQAFDVAERFQTPVFVLSDLDLGMNLWMAEPFEYPEGGLDRGKVLDEAALAKVEDWGRYKDVDGDGIPYRTIPGTPGGRGAFFARGSGHDEYARYTEDGEAYAHNVDRIDRKIQGTADKLPQPIFEGDGTKIGIIAYGTSHAAVQESRDQLRGEEGVATDYMRICSFPFPASVAKWIAAHERVYVVEQNRDGQMRNLLRVELPEVSGKLLSIRHYTGMPLDARTVTAALVAAEATAKETR
ncbi:MAG: 2-oxoacid:acceptor oxidoreductase subunit alpha [Planctomycetota bacterium]|nr:2-oxoacid:acceptor oxidoreductase subunit alpha [Planctomycetota bacterium]